LSIWKVISGVSIIVIAALTLFSTDLATKNDALSIRHNDLALENKRLSLTSKKLTTELATEKEKLATVTKALKYANSQAGYNIPLQTCFTSIDGQLTRLNYDFNENPDEETIRDILFGGKGEIDCPAHVTLRHLTHELSDTERGVFCLNYDKDHVTYTGISHGERNAYLVCKNPKTFCERVNIAKNEALAFATLGGTLATASASATAVAGAAGVTAVTHSSGAVILTGTGGYIAGTLGTVGASTLAVLTSPVVISAGVITVVGVGSSVYLCK
jgi:hypothetical protein